MTGIDAHTMPDPMPENSFDPWNFRTDVAVELGGSRLVGYTVEAIDGRVGKVTEARLADGDSYLVTDSGRWVFARRRQVPAGTVNHVDHQERRVYVDRSRDQIRAAPEVPADGYDDPTHREAVGSYYARTYRTPPRA